MSYHCRHCQSCFFKTLEVRVSRTHPALLRKKRCKRCKRGHVIALDFTTRIRRPAGEPEWRAARKIPAGGVSERCTERGKALIGEYTGRVRHAAEQNIDYLRRIRNLEIRENSRPGLDALQPAPTGSARHGVP